MIRKTVSSEKDLLRVYSHKDVPEFQALQAANSDHEVDSLAAAIMYGRAIHWMSFLDIIWPDFRKEDYVNVEVAYIVYNDPDRKKLPPEFYKEIAQAIAMFWRIQLENLYPNGDWTVEIWNDAEKTVQAHIRRR